MQAVSPVAARPGRAVEARAERQELKPREARRSIVASGLTAADLAALTVRGFRIDGRTRGTIVPQVVRLQVPRGMSPEQARRAVRMVDAAASADLDHFYYTDEGPSNCTGAGCEAISLVGWSTPGAAQCGAIPLIGLVDTGINLNHDALTGQAIEVLPSPESHANASLRDHGTAVAALLAGRADSKTPGLLPQAKILAVDAFYRDNGTADRTDVTSLVAAIEELADRHVRVINLSLSGPPNEVLRKAIEAARAKGIVIIAAAGNSGAGAQPSYPAAYPGVIAVTAVDRQLNIYRRATQGDYVDLAAPGVDVWTASSDGEGVLKSGTSYAVPFVSAAAALLRASSPDMDAEDLQARLEESTRDLGEPGRDPTFGYGLIQMSKLCSPEKSPSGPEPAVAASTPSDNDLAGR